MAKGKGIILLALGALMLGGKKSAAEPVTTTGELPLPGGGQQPGEEPTPTPGEEPTPGIVVPPIQVVFPIPQPQPTPGVVFPGPGEPIPQPVDVTPLQIFNSLIKPTPQPNAAYKVKAGDTLLGPNGICARAILAGSGEEATSAERYAYYEACSRVRSNWMLYATEPVNNPVEVTDENGDTVAGSITGAFFKMHDSWPGALAEDELPSRLIGFTRNQNLQPVPLGGWQERAHGQAKTTRQYGTLWLPDLACVTYGPDVFTNEQCDWPPSLFEAVGLDRMGWTA